MINSLLPSMNLFLKMWQCLPSSLTAFVSFALGIFIAIGLINFVMGLIK